MKTNFLNIHDLVLLFTALECVLLAVLLRVLPANRIQPRLVLATFFLLIGLVKIFTVLVWNDELRVAEFNQNPYCLSILVGALLLEGPFLFLYLRSLSEDIHILKWRNIIHIIPALIASSLVIVYDFSILEWQANNSANTPKAIAISLTWSMVKIIPIFYVLMSVWLEYRLRQQMKQLYSSISEPELNLADVILFGFCVQWLWSLIHYLFHPMIDPVLSDKLGIANNYMSVFLVNGLFIFGLLNTRQLINPANVLPGSHLGILEPTAPSDAEAAQTDNNLHDYIHQQITGNNGVDPEAAIKLAPKIALIEAGMHERKLFLESNINLERFSEQIGLRPRDTSAVLKQHYGVNFFEFINGYRVEEAKRLLAATEFKDETILELIFKSGFNSPSAFHRFFKRMVGVTPTEYRKQAFQEVSIAAE